MHIIRQLPHPLSPLQPQPLAMTVGHFDGVHIGHQALLNTVMQVAKQKNYAPAVMTFSPHAKLFFMQATNFLITSDTEKAAHIQAHGIQYLYEIPFDAVLSVMPAGDFAELLFKQLNVQYLLVGDDFRFGLDGKGDYALLRDVGARHGAVVEDSLTICHQGQRVSSSAIRKAIKHNDFPLAQALLGRALSYRGEVIYGKQLGRTIGFPTANLRLCETRLLPSGVFAVNVTIDDEKYTSTYGGMCNIGTNPTVEQHGTRQMEVHLFDFADDLYGKTLTITPVVKLRDEQPFDGIDALMAQLHRDKDNALMALQQFSLKS